MKKAYFIDGGLGRLLCSIPALEKKLKNKEDFVIVSEWTEDCFRGTDLYPLSYSMRHKGLFNDVLRDREIITPEPYRLNSYFNQKCNLVQAFDIIINESSTEDAVSKSDKITINLSKKEQVDGHNLVREVRSKLDKKKVIVFQPFGRGIQKENDFIYDSSGRSFELSDVLDLIKELNKDYGVILMLPFPFPGNQNELGIAVPENVPIRTWMGIINAANGFLGCDSVGQHISAALEKPTVVVTGSTYPENVSYPNTSKFIVIDRGKDQRKYAPIRITEDEYINISNEDLMKLNKSDINNIHKKLLSVLPVPKKEKIKSIDAGKGVHKHSPQCKHNVK